MTKKSGLALLLIPLIPGLFLVLTSSFELIPSIGVFNAKRVLEPVVMIGIFGVALVIPAVKAGFMGQLNRIPGWMRACLLVLLLLGLLSAVRFPHPGYGIVDVLTLALLVLGMLMVAATRQVAGSRFDRLVMGTLVSLGAVVALQEFMGLLAAWAMDVEFGYSNMLIRFAHPRFYNQLQTWSLLLLAALPFVFSGNKHIKIAAAVLLGLQWCLLFISGGRGSLLSLITALILVGLLARNTRRFWVPTHVSGLVVGALLYALVLVGHGFAAPKGGDFVERSVGRQVFNTTGRTNLWRLAIKEGIEHPLMGVGPTRYGCTGPVGYAAHPHNFPLRILSEWGFPSLVLVILVCATIGWRMLKDLTRQDKQSEEPLVLKSMLTASIVAAGIHACLSGLLTMPASQIMAVLICGWLLGIQKPAQSEAPNRKLTPLLICVLALLTSLGILRFNLNELSEMEYRTQELVKLELLSPRHWQHGKVCRYSYRGP